MDEEIQNKFVQIKLGHNEIIYIFMKFYLVLILMKYVLCDVI